MKTLIKHSHLAFLERSVRWIVNPNLVLALALGTPVAINAAALAQSFATPEEAVSALAAAVSAADTNALRVIFGPAVKDLENPDRVQAAEEFRTFAAALAQTNRIVRESDSKCALEVGNDFWPFPVPLVKRDGGWFFDSEAGKAELFARRIGRNELATLASVRAYVEAQREYASKDRAGDGVLKYAQKFRSAPGTKDGLYWPADLDGEESPLARSWPKRRPRVTWKTPTSRAPPRNRTMATSSES